MPKGVAWGGAGGDPLEHPPGEFSGGALGGGSGNVLTRAI